MYLSLQSCLKAFGGSICQANLYKILTLETMKKTYIVYRNKFNFNAKRPMKRDFFDRNYYHFNEKLLKYSINSYNKK